MRVHGMLVLLGMDAWNLKRGTTPPRAKVVSIFEDRSTQAIRALRTHSLALLLHAVFLLLGDQPPRERCLLFPDIQQR